MPPAVIDAMASFRAAIDANDVAQSQRLARAWLEISRGLDQQFEALARDLATAAARGRGATLWHVNRMDRYQSLLAQILTQQRRFAPIAAQDITQTQALLGRWAIAHSSQLVTLQRPAIAGQFDRLPVEAITNMVGNAGDGTPLGVLLRRSWGDEGINVGNVLVRGTALGWNPVKTARAMRDEVDVTLEHAILIGRTEQMRVYRETGRQQYIESRVVEGYLRVAANSIRTCMACLMTDGQFYPLSVPFEEHPNGRCLTPGTVVSGPVAESFVSRYYVGEVIEISTASGNFLSVTPNHPILTDRGWIAAQFLQEGDNVISGGSSEGISSGVDPHEYQVPTIVEDIPRALGMNRLGVMPVAAENFHGDGIGSDVYVVWANRLLHHALNAMLVKPLPEHGFGGGDVAWFSLSRFGNFDSMLKSLLPSATGFLGDLDAPVMLFNGGDFSEKAIRVGVIPPLNTSDTQAHLYDLAGYPIRDSQSIFGFTGHISGRDFLNGKRQIGEGFSRGFLAFDDSPADFVPEQPARLEFIREALLASVESRGGTLSAIASNVCLDRILKVSRASFSGHVYNLQTTEQWYIANGIITHNCTALPKVIGASPVVYETGEQWFLRQNRTIQRKMMGPGRYQAWQEGRFALADLVTVRQDDTWGNSLQVTPLRVLAARPVGTVPRTRLPLLQVPATPVTVTPLTSVKTYVFPHEPTVQQKQVVDDHVLDQIRRYARNHGLTEDEVRATVEQTLRELLENVPVSTRFKHEYFDKLQQSKRFKSQFETGTSGGALAPDYRAFAERKGLGYPNSTAPQDRPIYGYFNINQSADTAYWYGDLEFVFKDEVRARATFTMGDSLSLFPDDTAYGSPALAPEIGSADTAVAAIMEYAANQDKDDFLSQIILEYIEAQVHGGVQLSEVAYVIDHASELTVAERDWLQRFGIGVR